MIKIGNTYKKNNSIIMGALTQIRAFKQFDGALKCKTVKRLKQKKFKIYVGNTKIQILNGF